MTAAMINVMMYTVMGYLTLSVLVDGFKQYQEEKKDSKFSMRPRPSRFHSNNDDWD